MADNMTDLNVFSRTGAAPRPDAEENGASAPRVNFRTAAANDYLTSEAYKTLRTNLFFCGTDIKTVLLTSCDENEGKSTISTELSKSLAECGKRTLLIDADMRKSVMLKKSARAGAISGLSEVLSGLASPEEALCRTQDANFDVIFSGHFPPNPVELLGNGKLAAMLEQFKQTYDYIIIDSPPLGIVIDAAVIASYCDGAILVIGSGKVSRNTAKWVKEQLDKSGCRLLGAAINESEKDRRFRKKYYYGGKEYHS